LNKLNVKLGKMLVVTQ